MVQAVVTVISEVIKIGIPIYLAAFIASTLLLFLPISVVNQIGVDVFRENYRGYLGGTLICSSSFLLSYLIISSSATVKNRLSDRRLRYFTLQTLKMLTSEEKSFLRLFVVDGQNSVQAPISDGVAGGLVAKRIVYRAASASHTFSFPYNLQPIAQKILFSRPSLLSE